MTILKRLTAVVFSFILISVAHTIAPAQESSGEITANPYVLWQNGPSPEADFLPIGVWLQDPRLAQRYRKAGFNTYVGLHKGPTENQLAALQKAGMKVICHQNEVGLQHLHDPTIIGWMHGDEPDNAQPQGKGKGYGPPISPVKIAQDYEAIKGRDSTRPVLLNLGQGVAWDNWHGRGVRMNHPEDYPEYLRGCDIASFDIYPAVHASPEVSGKLWYMAKGVQRLTGWTGGKKVVWNCIECTRIKNETVKPTPFQVRSEVWMSLIHGSMGLIYFVHEWRPRFNASALLSDPEMLQAVSAINRQVAGLAPVLNTRTIQDVVTISSSNADVPVAMMVKQYQGAIYVFAVGMREGSCLAAFRLMRIKNATLVEVLGEERSLAVENGEFQDQFGPYEVHIYRIR